MADALTIYEEFGTLKDLNVTFIGDGNNVAVSLMNICAKLGANFTHSGPEGYYIPKESIEIAQNFANESGSKISFNSNPHAAVAGVNVIYTDTWTSMGQEEEALKREAVFPPFQVNKELVNEAAKDAIVLHCLPAHRGQEITDEVADGSHSRLFPQAHNRLHAQKAIIVRLLEKA
jgi:ornithine carbamoyltransferase